jgi:hypothetical protein
MSDRERFRLALRVLFGRLLIDTDVLRELGLDDAQYPSLNEIHEAAEDIIISYIQRARNE